MKIVKPAQTKRFKNSGDCTVIEFPFDDKDINTSIVELSGRYPEQGYVTNRVCKEIGYVMEGSGKLIGRDATFNLKAGDMALLLPDEEYYWEGEMKLLMPCAPAFYPEQHEEVSE